MATQYAFLTTFENIVGKKKMLVISIFLFFPTIFSTLSKKEVIDLAMLDLLSLNAFNLVKADILLFDKELNNAGEQGH